MINYKAFTTYVEINREFNESYRIVLPYRELEIHIVKWTHVFSSYKSLFVRLGHIYVCSCWLNSLHSEAALGVASVAEI